MRKRSLFGFFAVMIIAIACGQTSRREAVSTKTNDWKLLNETGYSIQYPDTFELDKSGKMGQRFMILSNLTTQQDIFRENVNLMIQSLTGQNIDLDKYIYLTEQQIKTMIIDGVLIESKRLYDNNKSYHRIIYSGVLGQYSLKWLQYIWVEKGNAYLLTLTSEQSNYDKYATVGEEIMKTFRIK